MHARVDGLRGASIRVEAYCAAHETQNTDTSLTAHRLLYPRKCIAEEHAPTLAQPGDEQGANVMDSGKFLNAQNKFGTTVAAITHFFANMATRALLSHFQTVNGKLPNRGFGKVIIDVILQNNINASEPHRPADNRPQGVKMVLNTHVCNRVCGLLELNETADDGRDDTSDEEEKPSDEDT
ncbi:hypothetical protein DFH06DRAFT_1139048 [Mycena polygramma]|nr:hypothetical protein DFH06DRAFT_1139048 [Mycena polygramma]